jgi:predicted transcriptional regulator
MSKKPRKSSVQIRFEILEYLYYNPGPHLRTYLWRKATDLSYDDFLKYLDEMKKRNLIQEENGDCRLTQEGRDVYVGLRDALKTIL